MRWLRMEGYLQQQKGMHQGFTSRDYAATVGVTNTDASRDIQSYLRAQRDAESRTLYELQRLPGTRTNSARWRAVGHPANARDVKRLGRCFSNDVRRKCLRAFEPDIRRIAEIDPSRANQVQNTVNAVINGALVVLESAVK